MNIVFFLLLFRSCTLNRRHKHHERKQKWPKKARLHELLERQKVFLLQAQAGVQASSCHERAILVAQKALEMTGRRRKSNEEERRRKERLLMPATRLSLTSKKSSPASSTSPSLFLSGNGCRRVVCIVFLFQCILCLSLSVHSPQHAQTPSFFSSFSPCRLFSSDDPLVPCF